ncbi:b628435a-f7c9-414c-9f17-943939478156 [Sclerotinia trifoliorum]|uniref:B628435a-f7c9-414c-9f17-943939478156 n=1 Tax=Sclerotinia trifoliorum TaxID=28548 RepID=A0A8H2VMI1_9HELO|nr:b628435a-f7c9-414c-9f17-943939478156 [Sclerotinia trifoliorum]
MQLPSPEIIASWPVPNYVDPKTRGNAVLVVNAILFPVALFIILIRLYTRLQISKCFGLDDWLIIAAMVPSTAFAVLAVLAEEFFKFNRHVWDLPLSQVKFGLQYVLITQVIFTLGQTLTKCSMLALLYRILSSGRRFKIMTIAATVIIAVQGTVFIIVVIFQCRPVSHYWLITFAPQPECINQKVHVTFAGSFNTLTDFFVVILPIPKMLKLQISQRQRLIVIFLFAAGFLVCIAGTVRTYYTYVELTSTDVTWDDYYVWISSSVELYVGIIGASVPAIKPFFTRYIPVLLGHTSNSSHKNHYVMSSSDKVPFSGSNTNTTTRTSRTPGTLPQVDIEMGHTPERELRTNIHSMNLDAIEEVRGSDTSLSSFVHIGLESDRERTSNEYKGVDIVENRDIGSRSEETFDYARTFTRTSTRNSKDVLIDEVDSGMAVPPKSHLSRSSR